MAAVIDPKLILGWMPTSRGRLCILVNRDPRGSTRPVVVVLHGALRHSENTQVWMPVLSDQFDVLLVDLPGHGRSPPDDDPSVAGFTERLREVIGGPLANREIVVIGESVGGLVAFGLGDGRLPQIKGVIVSDPPLTTAKLWPVFNNFLRPTLEPTEFVRAFYLSTFGYIADSPKQGRIVSDRIYYSLVAGVKVRTLILTGDLPLFPVRAVPQNVPCLLDEVDKAIISSIRNPHVSLQTIQGADHLCLNPARAPVREAVVGFCRDQLVRDACPA